MWRVPPDYDGAAWLVISGPDAEPAARRVGGEPLFGLYPLRLFNREVGGHLVDPGRHPVGQGPFDGEIGGMARLARGESAACFSARARPPRAAT